MRDGDRSIPRRLLGGAADEPVLALMVGFLLLLALGFLVAFIVVFG